MRIDPCTSAPPCGRITGMEGLRGYAVVLVFLVHFVDHYVRRYGGPDFERSSILDAPGLGAALAHYLWASHYGVDLFFLLSGFLIFRLIARPEFRYGRFLWHRLARLYPAFAVWLLVYTAYHAAFWNVRYDWKLLLQNALLLHGIPELGIRAILVPSWSLSFEWLFYLAMPPLLLAIRRWRAALRPAHVILAGLLVPLAAALIGSHYARFVMFFAGAWMAALPPGLLGRWASLLPDWAVLLPYLGVTLLFSFTQDYGIFSWPYAVVCGLLVAKTIAGDGMLARCFNASVLRRLGNCSYSLYLLHGLMIVVVVDHLGPRWASLPLAIHAGVLMLVSLLASAALAGVSYRWLERPYFKHRQRANDEPGLGGSSRPDRGRTWAMTSAATAQVRSEP
jgi:exopolysaccharide production protein ExoZ